MKLDHFRPLYEYAVKTCHLKKKQVPFGFFKKTFIRSLSNVLFNVDPKLTETDEPVKEYLKKMKQDEHLRGRVLRRFRWYCESEEGKRIAVLHAKNIGTTEDRDRSTAQHALSKHFLLVENVRKSQGNS